jgi:hypothetical protein
MRKETAEHGHGTRKGDRNVFRPFKSEEKSTAPII